jgi:hypothetical protein
MPRHVLHTYRYCYDDDYDALIWADIGFVDDDDEASFNHHIVISLGAASPIEGEWDRAMEAEARRGASVALEAAGDDARFQLLRLDEAAFLILSFSSAEAIAAFRGRGAPSPLETLFGALE